MQRIPQNRPMLKRSYLNLDAIFGHIFDNVTGEPLTPTRIATFYLLRILFETHFGKKSVRSEYPFSVAEKARVFQTLFSLMNLEEEVSYKTFRGIVRLSFGESRSITRYFYMAMEQLGTGMADINLYVEDEFYTNLHTKDPETHIDDYYRGVIEDRKALKFCSSHSFIYRWMKRLMAQHSKTNEAEMFDVNVTMRKWVMSTTEELVMPGLPERVLPVFIDCSVRARGWCATSLYLLQKCPRFAFTYDNMLHYTQLIQQRHRDVYEAYLLEAAIRVQQQDCPLAVRAMKTFFDYTMLDLNENMTHCSRTFRLAVPNTVPLLYAPLLHARICRTFGDYVMARQLLQESHQQAQLHSEDICHQLANLEILIIEIIGCNAILEDREHELPSFIEEDRRVQRKALRGIEDLTSYPLPGLPCCEQSEDEFELCCEMDCLGKQLLMLRMITKGSYKLKTGSMAETGILCPAVNDHEERGKKIEGYGYAIMSSNLIRNGMFDQARTATGDMLSNNTNGIAPEYFETESWAVAATNLAYSYAGQGEYERALDTLDQMEWSFPEDQSWQCARHVTICAAVVNFEKFFLLNHFKACEASIADLLAHSKLEYTLRRALLFASTGRPREGIQALGTLNITDVQGRIRIHMQMATIFNSLKQFEKAEAELEEARKIVKITTFRNIPSMINRRSAMVLMSREKYAEAIRLLQMCASDITTYGSYTEKLCFYITVARCLRLLNQDPRIWLKKARALVQDGQWPAMEKQVICELATLHDTDGLFPDPDRAQQMREQFARISMEWPGRCNWNLI